MTPTDRRAAITATRLRLGRRWQKGIGSERNLDEVYGAVSTFAVEMERITRLPRRPNTSCFGNAHGGFRQRKRGAARDRAPNEGWKRGAVGPGFEDSSARSQALAPQFLRYYAQQAREFPYRTRGCARTGHHPDAARARRGGRGDRAGERRCPSRPSSLGHRVALLGARRRVHPADRGDGRLPGHGCAEPHPRFRLDRVAWSATETRP